MSLYSQLVGRQYSSHGCFTGSLWPVLERLQSHYSDEVVVYGGMTAAPAPVFTCKFTRDGLHGNLLATGDEEGSVRLMDTRNSASQSLVKEIEAHRNAVFDVAWLPGGTKLLTGSGDATVRLWDVVGGVMLDEFKAHSASVKTVDVKMDEPSMFVSGGRDGNIHIWDTRCARRGSGHKPVNSIHSAHKKVEVVAMAMSKKRQRGRRSVAVNKGGDVKHSVTAALFHGYHSIASCGAADGLIKLWDLRRTYTNSRLEPPPSWHSFEPLTEAGRQYSFTSLVSGPHQSTLFASCTDNMCYMYNSAGLNKLPVRVFSGHQNSSFYVKSCVSPDGHYLLSGSSCGNAFLWQIDHPEAPPLLLSGHTKEVTAVAWCPTDLARIATCSDDNDVRLWRAGHGKRSPGEVTGTCQAYSGQGHLKGMEILKQHMEVSQSRVQQTRTPLHPIQQRSTKELSTPLAAKPTNAGLGRPAVLQSSSSQLEHQRHATTTEDKSQKLGSINQERDQVVRDDASVRSSEAVSVASSTATHPNKPCIHQHRTMDNINTCTCNGSSKQTLAEGTRRETKVDISVEGEGDRFMEVTPDRSTPDARSAAKRKLELEEDEDKRQQSKRRRTVNSGYGGKAGVRSCGGARKKNSGPGQTTMQSYFGSV